MNKAKDEIVRNIQQMSGRYSTYNIFSDWVKMCALTIQNSTQIIHNGIWQQRELQYLEILRKYTTKEQKVLADMLGMLYAAFENEISDILGKIYMEAECSSKATGQFFTPFHISYLTAQAIPNDISEDNKLYLNEPSSGGGGLIIAAAKVLQDRGLDYQRCMDVVAQDLDYNGVYMTYVQLSILGIKATVIQGDALANQYFNGDYPEEKVFYTPKKMGLLI